MKSWRVLNQILMLQQNKLNKGKEEEGIEILEIEILQKIQLKKGTHLDLQIVIETDVQIIIDNISIFFYQVPAGENKKSVGLSISYKYW